MIKTKDTYFTFDDVCKDLAFTSYEIEMKKHRTCFIFSIIGWL